MWHSFWHQKQPLSQESRQPCWEVQEQEKGLSSPSCSFTLVSLGPSAKGKLTILERSWHYWGCSQIPWSLCHVSKAGRWSPAVGRFTRTWQVLGDSYLSKHLKSAPLPKHCQLTDRGVANPGCPKPGSASTEEKIVHWGNEVDWVWSIPSLDSGKGTGIGRRAVLPKSALLYSSDMERSPETWCHPFYHP